MGTSLLVDQRLIHRLEAGGEYLKAAQRLIDLKFYQVSRSRFLLARLPVDTTPRDALELALLKCGNPQRDGPSPTARSAADQYLTYHAPNHDRIYVMSDTLSAYRKLGGGPYTPNAWGERRATGNGCVFCGAPANFMGKQLCDSCEFVSDRLPNFMKHSAARDHVLSLIGKIGLHETYMMIEGAHNGSSAREHPAREDRAGMEQEKAEGAGDGHPSV